MLTTPTRLLIVSDSIIYGGAESYMVNVGRGIAAQGWEVHAAFPHNADTSPIASSLADAGVTCHDAPFGRAAMVFGRRPRPVPQLIAFLAMRKLLLRLRPDVVLFVLAGQRASMPARIACGVLRVPALNVLQLTPRQSENAPRALRIYTERLLIKRKQRWSAVSLNTARFITDVLSIPKEHVAVIHNGIDLDLFSTGDIEHARSAIREELKLPSDALVLLTVARLGTQKAHDVLLDVLPEILAKHPRLYAVWIGEGELRAALEARIRAPDLSDRVLLLGYRNNVPMWYHGADYFAFPTHYEGFPHAVVEAAAAGLPIIASAEPGVCEFLSEERAFLVAENSTVAWAERLHELLTCVKDCRQRAERARVAVAEYDLPTMVARTCHQLSLCAFDQESR